tara:strand:+ start:655 stop:981 length:327 start_codon:yes stop_codon:yes gene_type:complete
MTKKESKKWQRIKSIEELRRLFKKGDTLYTQLHRRTRSGAIYFSVRYIRDNTPIQLNFYTSEILDLKIDKQWNCLKQPFGNMDMGFHTIYTLSQAVFNDGYYLNHEWL